MFINVMIIAICLITAGMLGYWAQDREVPLEIEYVKAMPPNPPPGGMLKIEYKVNRRRICHVYLEQFLYDSQNVRYPISDEDFISAPGTPGPDLFAVQLQVPHITAEGPARYRSIRTFFCNPIHYWFHWPIVLDIPDVKFEVRRQQ